MKKNSKKTSSKKVIYTSKRIDDMSVVINAHENCNMKVTGGRVLLNERSKELLFMQNKPRGPRSTPIMKTIHSSVSLMPDGDYKIITRFSMDEENCGTQLVNEIVEIFFLLKLTDDTNPLKK